jgi:hypothetical protein
VVLQLNPTAFSQRMEYPTARGQAPCAFAERISNPAQGDISPLMSKQRELFADVALARALSPQQWLP